jgi:hypothetical protein
MEIKLPDSIRTLSKFLLAAVVNHGAALMGLAV